MDNYLILTNDKITLEDVISKIKNKNNLTNDSVIRFDLQENTVDQVIEELNTYSFLVDKKIVVVSSTETILNDKKSIKDEEKLLKYIDNINSLNSLILIASKIDERKKLVKSIKAKFIVVNNNISIIDKIKASLEDYNMDIKTINYLIKYLNNDNERIINELEKLKMYKLDTKTITIDDINTISIKEFDENIFSLINAINDKNIKKAFEIYNDLIERGEEMLKIVISVTDHFRLLYTVKVLVNDKKSSDTITSMLGIHPYRVKLAIENSYKFSFEELKKYLKQLGNIDINIKTGVSANDYGFDLFLLNL